MKTNSNQPMYVTILRWFAVLPGSFAFALLMDFPVHWIVMLKSHNPDEPNLLGCITLDPATLEHLAYALLNPVFMIMASAYIAPSKRFPTAVVMAILITIFVVYSCVIIKTDAVSVAGSCLRVGLNIIGTAIALFIVHENQSKSSGT